MGRRLRRREPPQRVELPRRCERWDAAGESQPAWRPVEAVAGRHAQPNHSPLPAGPKLQVGPIPRVDSRRPAELGAVAEQKTLAALGAAALAKRSEARHREAVADRPRTRRYRYRFANRPKRSLPGRSDGIEKSY